MIIETSIIDTPIGAMHVGATAKGLCMLEFDNPKRLEKHYKAFAEYELEENAENAFIVQTSEELSEYFDKQREQFDVPLDLIGTDFQRSVWTELLSIPFGTTRSYLMQSKAIGDVNAIRAVANANGQNRISIIVPCHRVIGSNGSLTGYGGKLWRKKYLLELESNQTRLF